jgi:hypothetical protein
MSVAQNYEFEIIPVNYPDYIDLICNFKIKENE